MLIICAFVNETPIGRIQVQNVGLEADGRSVYLIREPRMKVDNIIRHDRTDGWKDLAIKVLQQLEEEE